MLMEITGATFTPVPTTQQLIYNKSLVTYTKLHTDYIDQMLPGSDCSVPTGFYFWPTH